MQEILFGYQITPTTWAYLSSMMTIGIYFKFNRFWSVRNLDLAALIAYAPGLLLIFLGKESNGYVWMFAVNGFFLIRMLLDPVMVRRPLLEPNLSVSGLTFTGLSLLVFLMANVINNPPERVESALYKAEKMMLQPSPGYALFYEFASYSGRNLDEKVPPEDYRRQLIRIWAVRTTAILAHLAVVLGLVLVGYRHFDNIHTGVALGSLYLLLFYTSQVTGPIDHVVPAALLVWAFVAYRHPWVAGVLLGTAAGLIYYPLFLLPLWCGFYWQRGAWRFAIGMAMALAAMVALSAIVAGDREVFVSQLRLMFGVRDPFNVPCLGFWQFHVPAWRIPVLAAFVGLSGSLALWPPQKNLGTLLGCSAAVMIASQFWHANQGGIYLAWYLPLLLLTIFRPNLEDRVALSAVRDLRWPWRRSGRQAKAES